MNIEVKHTGEINTFTINVYGEDNAKNPGQSNVLLNWIREAIAIKTKDVALAASIISENMFEQVLALVKINKKEGVMGTHDKISELAIEFEKEHRHITDWSKEAEDQIVSDYEECILKWTFNKLSEEAI